MFPTIGSTITAAIWPGCVSNALRMASRSLNGTTIVSATEPAVTPAEPGMPSVTAPEPAATSS